MGQLALSQRELFFVLDREFQRLHPPECYRCRTPLPVRRATSDPSASNWQIENPGPCPEHCNLILMSIVERMQGSYALATMDPSEVRQAD